MAAKPKPSNKTSKGKTGNVKVRVLLKFRSAFEKACRENNVKAQPSDVRVERFQGVYVCHGTAENITKCMRVVQAKAQGTNEVEIDEE